MTLPDVQFRILFILLLWKMMVIPYNHSAVIPSVALHRGLAGDVGPAEVHLRAVVLPQQAL